ncbi:MAG: histone deacetylase [Anaerolineales bacterium]|nr:histone deacetylase [Anaerolineales bacterium]
MMATGYLFDTGHRAHTHPQAPESAARLDSLMEFLEKNGELELLDKIPIDLIPWEWVEAVHTKSHVDAVRRLAKEGKKRISFDTYLTPAAPQVALLGASSAICATRAVLENRVANAFSLMRTPGHHALSTNAMGYCIFNNVAIAASYALREHGLERVMIVDIDAHHGNGTEEIFSSSGQVLFVSYHQHPWFPGTGVWHRNGTDAGLGTNFNVELPQWSGDQAYLQVLDELILPLAERYRPQLVLVSAGFDAHWMDHSSVLGLSARGYFDLVNGLKSVAERFAGGRLVLLLEGGYNLQALCASVQGALRAMQGKPPLTDSLGSCPDEPVASVDGILAYLKGFMDLVVPPDGQDYYAQPAQVPYGLR